jgi:hypothetical protein
MSELTQVSDVKRVVDGYIAMWNETDPQRRRALIAETIAEDGSYVDPLMTGAGVEGIDAMIGAAQQQFPGHSFKLASGPDAHHDRVRFTWSLSANGAAPVAVGVDFATVATDGRLRAVTGFLEGDAAA